MTIFGQSAGGTSVAVHSFWHPDDPIVQAMIMQSGQAESTIVNDPEEFIRVANATGCVNKNRTAELDCMMGLEPLALRNGVSLNPYNYFASPYGGSLTVDNLTFFPPESYIQTGMEGKFAKIPYLIGSTNNEGDGIVPFSPEKGLNRTFADAQTLGVFTCPSALSAGYDNPSTNISPSAFFIFH
jgi:acetylcholinesterase